MTKIPCTTLFLAPYRAHIQDVDHFVGRKLLLHEIELMSAYGLEKDLLNPDFTFVLLSDWETNWNPDLLQEIKRLLARPENKAKVIPIEEAKAWIAGELAKARIRELADMVDPIIKWLNENYHLHVAVHITPTGAELFEGMLYVPAETLQD